MTAHILDGKALSARLRTEMGVSVAGMQKKFGRAPGLAVVLVGADPASEIYVNNKKTACAAIGIESFAHHLPIETSQEHLLGLIGEMNQDPHIDGILVQLPLPAHINPDRIIEAIAPHKDVDGFHPYNLGRLTARKPALRSCTPYGCMRLLEETGCNFHGLEAVVVGASNIVGRPMAMELLLAGSTVTITHRFTEHLAAHIARADIVVAAAGKAGLVRGEWIKDGAIVIDVGIHRQQDGSLTGDVGFDEAVKRAAWITPVPGGVGPMTICMLMQNTVQAYAASHT